MMDQARCSFQVLFISLLILQAVILCFSIITNQFITALMSLIMRILLLTIVKCCNFPFAASFYSVLAFIASLYTFDPVGLFITAHGQSKTLLNNILCIFIFVLLLICSYLGYLLRNQVLAKIQRREIDDDFQNRGPNNYINPNNQTRDPPYLYNRPQNNIDKNDDKENGHQNKKKQNNSFQPFSGQAHSLE